MTCLKINPEKSVFSFYATEEKKIEWKASGIGIEITLIFELATDEIYIIIHVYANGIGTILESMCVRIGVLYAHVCDIR